MIKSLVVLVLGVVCTGSIFIDPTASSAEVFWDAYGGAASTESEDVLAERINFPFIGPISSESATRRVDFDPSFTVGTRVGYWLERYPWFGGAIDGSYFAADGDTVDISVGTLSFLMMLRWPLLTSEDFPKGRLQPYAGIGPGIFFADLTADFRPTVSERVDEFVAELGLDLRGGLAWLLNPRWAIFAEYRFTHFGADSDVDVPFPGFGTDERVETTLSTYHALGGVSVRF